MIYTPISPPWRATARFRPETPAALTERRKQRLERLVAQFERDDIEAAVDSLIAALDARDGDPDLEDGHDAEGSMWPVGGRIGSGPHLSDDHEIAGDEADASFPEYPYRAHPQDAAALGHEDGEDDDPAGDAADDQPGDAAWPETLKQPDYMFGGLAGTPGDEDAEPWRTGPHWPTPTANDNERRAA